MNKRKKIFCYIFVIISLLIIAFLIDRGFRKTYYCNIKNGNTKILFSWYSIYFFESEEVSYFGKVFNDIIDKKMEDKWIFDGYEDCGITIRSKSVFDYRGEPAGERYLSRLFNSFSKLFNLDDDENFKKRFYDKFMIMISQENYKLHDMYLLYGEVADQINDRNP